MTSPSRGAALAALLLAVWPQAGQAQVLVHDAASYTRLIEQAQTALGQLNTLKSQLAQTEKLYDGFNRASDVGALAPSLATPASRQFLPDIDAYMAAAKGDLSALGQIGQKAEAIRAANRLHTPAADDLAGQDLEASGNRAARDLALGQQAASVGAERLTGLETLTAALDAAPNARAVMDIQARLSAEQTMIANDQMRLQGLAMAQAAEERLQRQRDLERASAARAARMAFYRRGFQ